MRKVLFFLSFFLLAATPAQEFKLRLSANPTTLDWNLAHTSQETYILMNLMEGLVELDAQMKPEPALAERWTLASQGKTYTFFLKPGILWSDSKPLSAKHFQDSWLRLLSPETDSPYAHLLFGIRGARAFHEGTLKDPKKVGISVINSLQLKVELEEPLSYFPQILSFWVTFPIRLDLIQKHGTQWTRPEHLASLGPYLLEAWKPGEKIRMKRNPKYRLSGAFQKAPTAVELLIEPNDEKARALFFSEELDVLLRPTTEDLLKSDLTIRSFPYLSTFYLGFNQRKKSLQNLYLRKAVALALEVSEIPAALQGGQKPAQGWIPIGMPGFGLNPAFRGTLYDARGALTRAGFPEGQGVSLSLFVEKFDGAEKLAEFLKKSLGTRLGIQLQTQIAEPALFNQKISEGEADLFVGHWGADFADPSNFFEVFLSESGTNKAGWKNKAYDALVLKASHLTDWDTRLQTYAKAEKLLLEEEVVVVPLFYQQNAVALGKRVQSVHLNPLNYLFFKEIELKTPR